MNKWCKDTVTDDKIKSLDNLLDSSDRIAIVTHINPDGDAVGSSCALLHFLREIRHKDAFVALPNSIPDSLAFISDGKNILISGRDDTDSLISGCDLIVCLDVNGFERTGALSDSVRRSSAAKILIDHHLNPSEGDFNLCFSKTDISSASELLYYILLALPEIGGDAAKLPMTSAGALMTGMTTDTNNFANSVWPSTLAMAGDLLSAGVDRDEIIARLYNEYRENRVLAMSELLKDHMKILENGTAYVIAYRDLLDRYDIREGELEGLVNVPLTIGRVRMSILLKEDEGFFRVSIRSKKGVSANRMAMEHFNGGGHEQAAGGRLYFPQDIAKPGDAEEYIKKVTE